MLPSETMIWQPEFTDKTLSRKPGAVHLAACPLLLDKIKQQVAAFALPATCRPEGYLAAQRNGTLIQVAPQQTRTFTVTTGIE
ncbi:TPA: hypothetical protein HI073_001824 [Escherichia coli]|nr:hypothetical protein [Escherichia coli]